MILHTGRMVAKNHKIANDAVLFLLYKYTAPAMDADNMAIDRSTGPSTSETDIGTK